MPADELIHILREKEQLEKRVYELEEENARLRNSLNKALRLIAEAVGDLDKVRG